MALISSKKVETNRHELIVEVKGEAFVKAVDLSFKKNSKKISLPGFRKGKAPRAMIERAYGKGVFYDDAISELYPQYYSEAVKETGITPVDAADVEIEEIDDNGFTFKATVTVKPEVALGKYKGIEAAKPEVDVNDEEIEKQLNDIREKFARVSVIEDRAAKNGDIANIDFEGFVDDIAFPGGKGEDYTLPLGSGTFIPGFEEQIVGHNTGDAFDVEVTFPEEYGEATLAGKKAIFKVTVKSLTERLLPEMDDEFAKDASEFDTLTEFKADIEKKTREHKETDASEAFESALIEAIVNDMTVEIPECMYTEQVNEMAKNFSMQLSQQGIKMDDFIKYTGDNKEKFLESFRPQAEQQVKSRLAMEAVAAAEGIVPSKEEIDAEFEKLAVNYKMDVAELRMYIREDDLSGDIACKKALDVIVENAKISGEKKPKAAKKSVKETEVKEPKEVKEKPAKATKAKAKKADAE